MEPELLKEEWLKSETHRFIAEKMLVLENGFEINDIKVIAFNSSAFGIHIEFYLNSEPCFITVLTNSLLSNSNCCIYDGFMYNLLVVDHNDFLELSFFTKSSEVAYTIKCQELTMGPINGKRINV